MTKPKRKLFGTDGIRGVANKHPMTSEVALALGRSLTRIAKRQSPRRSPRVVIGKDTRLSGYMLETAMASGICSVGGEVMLVVRWKVFREGERDALSQGHTRVERPAEGSSHRSLVKAMSAALADLSQELASAVRQAEAGRQR